MRKSAKRKAAGAETAAQAMARINTETLALIEQLKEQVRVNNEKFETSGRTNWGYVGNAAATRDDLKSALGIEA